MNINEKGIVNIFSNPLNDINKQSIKEINPAKINGLICGNVCFFAVLLGV